MTTSSQPLADLERPRWLVPVRALEKSIAVVVALAMVIGVTVQPHHPSLSYLAYVMSAVGVLLARRHWISGLLLVVLAPLVAYALGSEPVTLWTIASFQAFVLGVRGRPALWVAAISAVANFATQALSTPDLTLERLLWPCVAAMTAIAATAWGSALRANHAYWSALEARARDAITERELVIQRSIAEERVRIARDLHDSVGHAVAVVSMRLGAAEVLLPPQAEGPREQISAAHVGVQQILRETQEILRVLRMGEHGADTSATAEIRHVPDLVATFSAAGLRVRADFEALDQTLPAQVDSAAHRIVQEALTNAHKHGRGEVALEVKIRDEVVHILVQNDIASGGATPQTAMASGGHGLVGMQERARAAGGRLHAGADGSRFILRAELPTHTGGAQ